MDLEKLVRSVPDFPKEGIIYRDITPILKDSSAFKYVVNQLSANIPEHIDSIIAPESRGFIFASAVCFNLDKNLVIARKKGKLPYKTFEVEYELEYGTNTIELQEGILGHTSRVIIADDLVATGGSLLASQKLCEDFGATVLANIAMLDLSYIRTPEKEQLKNLIVIEKVLPLIEENKEQSLDKHGWE